MRVVRALGADIFFFRAIFRNNAPCELDLEGRGPLAAGGSAGLLGPVGWTAQRQVPPLAHAASHFTLIRLRTFSPDAAAFYARLGFQPTGEADATHILPLG